MPKVDFSKVEESSGNGFQQLPEGAYIMRIERIEPHENEQYIFVEWDVASGEWADWARGSNFPPRDVISWKNDKALSMAKHKLHILTDDNTGFDAEVAFYNDDWRAFEGKVFGAVIRKRLYTKKDGTDGEGIEIGTWKRVSEVKTGDWKPMRPRDTRDAKAQAAATAELPVETPKAGATDVYDEDIPF